jgi:hypothetical protein
MNTEDTIGEGTRLTNAKKAGQVIADLLRAGDRILVQDWSAVDNPPAVGCRPMVTATARWTCARCCRAPT